MFIRAVVAPAAKPLSGPLCLLAHGHCDLARPVRPPAFWESVLVVLPDLLTCGRLELPLHGEILIRSSRISLGVVRQCAVAIGYDVPWVERYRGR
jgi:hypothetical protein